MYKKCFGKLHLYRFTMLCSYTGYTDIIAHSGSYMHAAISMSLTRLSYVHASTKWFWSQDARRSFAAKESEVTTLRQSLEESIGSHAAYKALKKCGEGTLGEYNYKICPFEDAKQGHVP